MSLSVKNATKRFGSKTAVDKICFNFDKPGVFGLLGTNGAGKTTTIRLILGILARDEGEILWNGKPVSREDTKFGYLPEERGIYPKAKVEDQLIYFGKLKGMSTAGAKKQVNYWLERLGAAEYKNRIAEQLSKGNQQKIQLIAALINDPELLVLDEPFSGLDPVNTDLFKGVIKELIDNNKYIIMSSHQMSTVEEYCKDILILHNGLTVLSGNLKEIKAGYGRTNLSIECSADMIPLAEKEGIVLKEKTPFGYEFTIQEDSQAFRLLSAMLQNKYLPDKFEIREPSLHEIFVEKVGVSS
ncbi:MAG: ABC transporter ATP-binding protein [Clostridiales bacterium 43-6]|nr:MAG: ABC transporter ATP-binding protein [Clostridiales bacterium 43-6]